MKRNIVLNLLFIVLFIIFLILSFIIDFFFFIPIICFFPFSFRSTKHNKFGQGREIEKNTFIIKGEREKSHPHHYFNKAEITRFFNKFTHLTCIDEEQFYPGLYHWHLLSQLTAKH